MPASARWKTRRASQYSGASRPVTARHHRARHASTPLSPAAHRRLLPGGRRPLRPEHLLTTPQPALGPHALQRPCALRDLVILRDLDPLALRRGEDFAPRLLLRVDALERGLVEARDGVADVLLVVDGKVLATLFVDVREVLRGDVLTSCFGELCHCRPPYACWRPKSSAPLATRRNSSGPTWSICSASTSIS